MPPRFLGSCLAVTIALAVSLSIASFPAASQNSTAGQGDGSADAVTNLRAYAEYKMGHYEAAREIWEGLAAKGNTTALINLSNMFSQGNGVSADERKAFNYTRQAAELGDARAQHELGLAYEKGSFVQRDIEKAGEWLRKSAAQDYSDGQFAYGVLIATGRGKGFDRASEADRVEAVSWLKKAQARGNIEAAGYIELLDTSKRDAKE